MECPGPGDLTATDDLSALLLLRLLPGLGDRALVSLLEASGGALRALEMPGERFRVTTGARSPDGRRNPELLEGVERILDRCHERAIRVLSVLDPRYPASLRPLSDPPPVLFLRGRSELLYRPSVAVVGSRRATSVGRRAADRIGRDLSAAGVTVVSGLARGIDGAAHRGALGGAGGTIAVLGCGPDRAYPAANGALFDRVVREGLVVSEFPPGEAARAYHFPRRNRVLAALCSGVVVVEAAARSGALITVDHALDLGLEVFAVPGSIETPQAEGTNALLRDGAHVVTSATDVLETLGWEPRRAPTDGSSRAGEDGGTGGTPDAPRQMSQQPEHGAAAGRPDSSALPDRRVLADCLGRVPRTLDELVEASRLPPSRILSLLTALEVEGVARRGLDGWIAEPTRRDGIAPLRS